NSFAVYADKDGSVAGDREVMAGHLTRQRCAELCLAGLQIESLNGAAGDASGRGNTLSREVGRAGPKRLRVLVREHTKDRTRLRTPGGQKTLGRRGARRNPQNPPLPRAADVERAVPGRCQPYWVGAIARQCDRRCRHPSTGTGGKNRQRTCV